MARSGLRVWPGIGTPARAGRRALRNPLNSKSREVAGPALRNRAAAVTRIGFLDVGGGAAGRGLEQFLQESGLASARRRLAGFERDHMAVPQAVMAYVDDLVLLVEIDRHDLALQHHWLEEGDLLLGRGDVIPAVIAEGGGGGSVPQMLLHRGLGVLAGLDRGFGIGIRQIAALVDH